MPARLPVLASLLCLLAIASPARGQAAPTSALPPEPMALGWSGSSGTFRVGVDEHGGRGGGSAGHLTALSPHPSGSGTITQFIRADKFRGQRVRLSGYIRTKGIAGTSPIGAGLWLRVDGGGGTESFDNTQERRFNGTKDWTRMQIVLEIPDDALGIAFGCLMEGPGEAWVDDLVLEPVSRNVPLTSQFAGQPDPSKLAAQRQSTAPLPLAPSNLDFELHAGQVAGMASERAPAAWEIGSSRTNDRVGLDSTIFHGGTSSGHITAVPRADTTDFGYLWQQFRADNYRGKRVRFSAYVRTRGTTGPGANLDMAALADNGVLASDNMAGRPIRGTTAWTKYDIVLDVPQEAAGLTVAFSMRGPGEAWIDDATIDVVGTNVPVTAATKPPPPANPQTQGTAAYYATKPPAPTNLNFEAAR